jgi:pyroglutamyl-peptidase
MTPWILVTGFGPFPGVPDNPTARIARRLDGLEYGGARVRAFVLDVSYLRAAQQVRAAVEGRGWPAFVVHFGVACSADRVRVETVAINRKDASIADIDDHLGEAARIDDSHALDARVGTTIDAASLTAALNEQGVPAKVSDDAGRYVCNATYFQSLIWLAAEGVATPCVFVHVPDIEPGSVDPSGAAWTDDRLFACGDGVLRWMVRR